jgi:hypothetical protein
MSLMMATTTSLSAEQSDNPQTQPSVTVTVPSNPAATGKRSHANPSRLVVACSGPFAKDSSHLKLTMTYDLNNIDFGEVDTSSGKTMASIVFPKDPKRRLEVCWSDPNKRKDTYLIVINGSSTRAGPNGLRLGLSLLDLEKLNGKPFKVRGFDKNKVDAVTDWKRGQARRAAWRMQSWRIIAARP